MEQLDKIKKAATKLSELLAEDAETRRRIERELPLSFDGCILKSARIIQAAATRASVDRGEPLKVVRRRRGGAIVGEKFGSTAKMFVRQLAEAYETAAFPEKVTGPGFNVYANDFAGEAIISPFVRFALKAAGELGIPAPKGKTIQRALAAREEAKQPR